MSLFNKRLLPLILFLSFITVSLFAQGTVHPDTIVQEDCTDITTGCTYIDYSNDTVHSNRQADGSVRKDPRTGTMWMAYSWTHTVASGTISVIDILLQHSTDGGNTWVYDLPLYVSGTEYNPTTGNTDYTAHEVINIYPMVKNNVTNWFAVHSTYDIPPTGGGPNTQPATRKWWFASCAGTGSTGPACLATTTNNQFIGQTDNNDINFPVNPNLNSLNTVLSACTKFYEPVLISPVSSVDVYLFLQCGNFYAAFKTADPLSTSAPYTFTFVTDSNLFATHANATNVCGQLPSGSCNGTTSYPEIFNQMDLFYVSALSKTYAVMSMTYNPPGGKVSDGCVVLELATLDPPTLATVSGNIKVDAYVTSSDSSPKGPGSCTFSASHLGVVIARKVDTGVPSAFVTNLMQSGVLALN